MHVILGEYLISGRKIPDNHYEVPCPLCLDPMILSADKLIDVYSYYLISDSIAGLDVMCSECGQNGLIRNMF